MGEAVRQTNNREDVWAWAASKRPGHDCIWQGEEEPISNAYLFQTDIQLSDNLFGVFQILQERHRIQNTMENSSYFI